MRSSEDAHLPGLSRILAVDAFLERLRRTLPECPEEIEVEGGRIFDVQYTPGERAIVLYQLKLRERGGTHSQRQLLAVRALGRGAAAVAPHDDILARYRRLGEAPLRTPYLPMPEEGWVAHAFPLDPALPGLMDAVDGQAMRRALHALWRERGVRVHDVKVRRLGYTPGARAALAYQVLGEDRRTRVPEVRRLVGKLHVHKRASATFAKAWAAWAAAGRRVPLAPPVGTLPDLDVSLQEHVDGERLGDLAGTAPFAARLREVARALASFHTLGIPVSSRRSAEKEIAVVDRWCATIAAVRPDAAPRVARLRRRLATRLQEATRPGAVVHGDCHPANVLARPDGITLIDLDQMARGDALLDVGRFLAALRVSALRVSGELSMLDDAAGSFLETYLRHSGESEGRARLFEAACLLTAAGTGFRLQREGWEQHTTGLLDEAERVLDRSATARSRPTAAPSSSRVDPARWHRDPQLVRALLDEPVRAAHGAVLTQCRIRPCREGRRVRLHLSGHRDGEPWKKVLEGLPGVRRADVDLEAWSALCEAASTRPDAPQLAGVLAFLAPLQLLVVESLRGRSLATAIARPEGPEVAERAGIALAALHATPVEPQRRRTIAAELAATHRCVGALAAAHPALATAARRAWEGAVRDLPKDGGGVVPSLGGLGPEAILWNDGEISFAAGPPLVATHPAVDLAETLARLAARALARGHGADAGPLRARLRHAYLRRAPVEATSLRGFEALALLRMASRAARKGAASRAQTLVEWAEREIAGDTSGCTRVHASSSPPRPALDRLWRTLARECRGPTAVVGPPEPELLEVLSRRGVSARELALPSEIRAAARETATQAGAFETLLLHGSLERVSRQERERRILWAWQQLKPEGRLVVCVPNPAASPEAPPPAPLDRRRLRRLLRTFGRPRTVTSQPYRWLVMRVEAAARPSPGVLERYAVIADLCRGRVLELGCGPGDLCAAIAARGLPVAGIDRNEQKIACASDRFPGIHFRACDILTLDADEARADTVVLSEVLEHVDAPTGGRILERAWSLVGPGGRLVISVPNEDCVPHPNHVREFDRASLTRLLEGFGPPRICVDQPFRYLLMTVERGGDEDGSHPPQAG